MHLKLLDKMHKYQVDPTKIVGATERPQDADGRTDRRTEWNQYTRPLQRTLLCGGYDNSFQQHFSKISSGNNHD